MNTSPIGDYKPSQASPMVMGFVGSSILDPGYVYAPYIPLQTVQIITPEERARIKREIKEIMRVPANIIKNAMKQAGYKFGKDFEIIILDNSETIIVTSRPGRRFIEAGTCQIHCNKGKMNIFWTYDPSDGLGGKAHKEVDIVLADPDSLKKVSDTIVEAVKVCLIHPSPYLIKHIDSSLYGKVTI